MTDAFDCLTINDLTPFNFIGGTIQVLTFDIYDVSGCAVDITATTPSWVMSPYGNSQYATLTLLGTLSGSMIPNRFTVTISGSNTQDLYGKFTHQPVITDFDGSEYRPSQGVLVIQPRNAAI
jgi:hypothetical protein